MSSFYEYYEKRIGVLKENIKVLKHERDQVTDPKVKKEVMRDLEMAFQDVQKYEEAMK